MGRGEFLQARLDYIGEMMAEGMTKPQIANAVELDDLVQVELLMMTAMDRTAGRSPRIPRD